jgi:hypothetical protein
MSHEKFRIRTVRSLSRDRPSCTSGFTQLYEATNWQFILIPQQHISDSSIFWPFRRQSLNPTASHFLDVRWEYHFMRLPVALEYKVPWTRGQPALSSKITTSQYQHFLITLPTKPPLERQLRMQWPGSDPVLNCSLRDWLASSPVWRVP